MCLAQGHNAVTPVRLEPVAPRSRVKHSTTEPLPSLNAHLVIVEGIDSLLGHLKWFFHFHLGKQFGHRSGQLNVGLICVQTL